MIQKTAVLDHFLYQMFNDTKNSCFRSVCIKCPNNCLSDTLIELHLWWMANAMKSNDVYIMIRIDWLEGWLLLIKVKVKSAVDTEYPRRHSSSLEHYRPATGAVKSSGRAPDLTFIVRTARLTCPCRNRNIDDVFSSKLLSTMYIFVVPSNRTSQVLVRSWNRPRGKLIF